MKLTKQKFAEPSCFHHQFASDDVSLKSLWTLCLLSHVNGWCLASYVFMLDCFSTTYIPLPVDLSVNACNSDPCENGGQCFQGSEGGFACQCLANFRGPLCQFGKDDSLLILLLSK